MIDKADTPRKLADYLEDYLSQYGALIPGRAFAGATEKQVRMIIYALRHADSPRSKA